MVLLSNFFGCFGLRVIPQACQFHSKCSSTYPLTVKNQDQTHHRQGLVLSKEAVIASIMPLEAIAVALALSFGLVELLAILEVVVPSTIS